MIKENVVYESPNGIFVVVNRSTCWSRVFGETYMVYDPKDGYVKPLLTLKSAYEWLYKLKAISKDELKSLVESI